MQFSEEMKFYGAEVERSGWPDEKERARIEEMSRKARVRLEESGGGEEGGEKEELLAEMLAASLKSVSLLGEGVCRLADLQVRKRPAEFYENWLSSQRGVPAGTEVGRRGQEGEAAGARAGRGVEGVGGEKWRMGWEEQEAGRDQATGSVFKSVAGDIARRAAGDGGDVSWGITGVGGGVLPRE